MPVGQNLKDKKAAAKVKKSQAPRHTKPLSKVMPSGKGPAQLSKIPKKGQNVMKGRGSLTYDA